MRSRLILAGLWLLGSVAASGQLTGQFYLKKTFFARWEPIFLYYRITNDGREAVEIINTRNPEQPGCSGHSIRVSSDPSPTSVGCVSNGPLAQPRTLRPGESYTERFLLNFSHEINLPGDYWVEAKHSGMWNKTAGDSDVKLRFHIGEDTVAPNQLQSLLDALHSTDREKRIEAARILASLAPPSLENALFGFANEPEFRRYAPLAFHRLNTTRSMEKMAELMQGPATNEQLEAAQYLADTHDQHWYPLLRDAAVKNAQNSSFPEDAAELGGDKALPMLVTLAQSPDREFTAGNAIMAMGATGSRDAIPVLVNYLNSPDINISDRASYALHVLTHHNVAQDQTNRNRRTEAAEWSEWLEREGSTARIYKASEFEEDVPLQ